MRDVPFSSYPPQKVSLCHSISNGHTWMVTQSRHLVKIINLYNKRRYVCLFVCLSVSMFRMDGQTAGPIETKLDTRTNVHLGSVSVKVNVKVIHVCVREWQNYETPGTLHESDTWRTLLKLRPEDWGGDTWRTLNETPYSSSNEARHHRHRAATPSGGRVITASRPIIFSNVNRQGAPPQATYVSDRQ